MFSCFLPTYNVCLQCLCMLQYCFECEIELDRIENRKKIKHKICLLLENKFFCYVNFVCSNTRWCCYSYVLVRGKVKIVYRCRFMQFCDNICDSGVFYKICKCKTINGFHFPIPWLFCHHSTLRSNMNVISYMSLLLSLYFSSFTRLNFQFFATLLHAELSIYRNTQQTMFLSIYTTKFPHFVCSFHKAHKHIVKYII